MQRRKEWAWSGELFSRPSWGGGQGRVMIRANVRSGAGWNALDGCTARSLLLATAVAACTYGSVCFFSHIFCFGKKFSRDSDQTGRWSAQFCKLRDKITL